jgi:antitoxin HigA-1
MRKETPMFDPVHPGEILKDDILADAGLTVARAAEILGVGRPALSAVLNGRASLSPEMALRFEKAFGVSMELMLKMQLLFDIAKMRKGAKAIKVLRFKRAA